MEEGWCGGGVIPSEIANVLDNMYVTHSPLPKTIQARSKQQSREKLQYSLQYQAEQFLRFALFCKFYQHIRKV